MQKEKSLFEKSIRLAFRIINVTILILLLAWGSYYLLTKAGYQFNFGAVFRYLSVFNDALIMTIKLSISAFALSVILGLVVALGRMSRIKTIADLSLTYVVLFRNIPLLVVIAIFNWGIGSPFPTISVFVWSVLALSVFEASYIGEIFRGGIASIQKEQIESAQSLGLNYFQCMRYVIIPQALRSILPSLTGQIVTLVKDSSLASIIGLFELTLASRTVVGSTFAALESFAVIAVYYFIICYPISFISTLMEKRMRKSHLVTS